MNAQQLLKIRRVLYPHSERSIRIVCGSFVFCGFLLIVLNSVFSWACIPLVTVAAFYLIKPLPFLLGMALGGAALSVQPFTSLTTPTWLCIGVLRISIFGRLGLSLKFFFLAASLATSLAVPMLAHHYQPAPFASSVLFSALSVIGTNPLVMSLGYRAIMALAPYLGAMLRAVFNRPGFVAFRALQHPCVCRLMLMRSSSCRQSGVLADPTNCNFYRAMGTAAADSVRTLAIEHSGAHRPSVFVTVRSC
jgi:hypothetical protein